MGSKERIFYIHENILRSTSSFFQAALNQEWKEGQERTITLPDDNPKVFSGYAHWLYTGKLPCQRPEGRVSVKLAKLYGLGEKLIDKIFQDRVLDTLITHTRKDDKYPTKKSAKIVYDSTLKGSPARKLMVDMYLMNANEDHIKDEDDELHFDFLIDLTRALLKERVVPVNHRKELKELDEGIPCSYHHHGKDEPCTTKGQ